MSDQTLSSTPPNAPKRDKAGHFIKEEDDPQLEAPPEEPTAPAPGSLSEPEPSPPDEAHPTDPASPPAAPDPTAPTEDELEAAVALIVSRRQAAAIAADVSSRYPPGYPKRLYNPRYKYEAIAIPLRDGDGNEVKDKNGLTRFSNHYRHFNNGSLLAESPEDEAWLRATAGVALYEKDSEDIQACTCGWQTYSQVAIAVCMRHH